jgi:hypothetical protein
MDFDPLYYLIQISRRQVDVMFLTKKLLLEETWRHQTLLKRTDSIGIALCTKEKVSALK